MTRPTLWHYVATRQELEWRADEVLGWVAKGELKLRMEYMFPLAEAGQRADGHGKPEDDREDFAGTVKAAISFQLSVVSSFVRLDASQSASG